jgi:hypothetical protein
MSRRDEGPFVRAGRWDAAALGLPHTLSRRLELDYVWRRVAGPLLAAKARAVAVRGGVLELAVDDPTWTQPVIDLLPTLAARLAATRPSAGVRRFRVKTSAGHRVVDARPAAGPHVTRD